MMFRRIVEDFEARLSPTPDAGHAFEAAHGKSEHERFANGEIEFEVHIRDIRVPDGTSLDVRVNGFAVAAVVVENGRISLRLSRKAGHAIPAVNSGTDIEVWHGAQVVIRGTFAPD